MVTLLFTSIVIIGFVGLALYFWQKPKQNSDRASLPPLPPPRSLFSEPGTTSIAPSLAPDSVETEKQRALLLERARSADKSALDAAQALGATDLYDEILNLLVAAANTDANLLALMSYVARHELPVNHNLAQAVLDSWKRVPDRNSTAKALHVAAMADDAGLFQSAIEAALQYWREGKLAGVSPVELTALFDGEFWVLSSRTRSSGAGFVLKRTLANARRELGNAADINQ